MKNMFLVKYVIVVLLSIAVPIVGMEKGVLSVHLMRKQISGVSLPVRQPEMTDVEVSFELAIDQKIKWAPIENAKNVCPLLESLGIAQQRMIPFYVTRQVSSSANADYRGSKDLIWISYPWILNDEEDTGAIFENDLLVSDQVKFICPRSTKVTLRHWSISRIDAEHELELNKFRDNKSLMQEVERKNKEINDNKQELRDEFKRDITEHSEQYKKLLHAKDEELKSKEQDIQNLYATIRERLIKIEVLEKSLNTEQTTSKVTIATKDLAIRRLEQERLEWKDNFTLLDERIENVRAALGQLIFHRNFLGVSLLACLATLIFVLKTHHPAFA